MTDLNRKIIAQNKRARFDYHFLDVLEAGIILTGSEVKSIRQGKVSINESYAGEMNGHIHLINANIQEYLGAKHFNHEPKRPRKLLLHWKQENKWLGAIRKKGVTIVPVCLYFNKKGTIKLEIALGQGKQNVDKRETIKQRDWQREKARVLKGEQ
ncbi:MAG: SsrA-binding protein SmpB [Proteobacteria bacterium]|nr:SsrA-binding protein SmpB [Pseudomonadota bacterium]